MALVQEEPLPRSLLIFSSGGKYCLLPLADNMDGLMTFLITCR